MTLTRGATMAGVVWVACCGCAVRQPMVLGRTVTVTPVTGPAVKGELIAAEGGQLILKGSDGPQRLPLAAVREVKVKRHDWGGRRGFLWSLIGGAATGGALTASCSSVATGCGGVGVRVFAVWMVIGGLSSLSMESSSQLKIPVNEETLRLYARFPQGLPPRLDDPALVPPGLRPGIHLPGPPDAGEQRDPE